MRKYHSLPKAEFERVYRIIDDFAESMKVAVKKQIITNGKGWDEESDVGNILMLRKALVLKVKQGMQERLDMEGEIAIQACRVWWARKTGERLLEQSGIDISDETLGRELENKDWDRLRDLRR